MQIGWSLISNFIKHHKGEEIMKFQIKNISATVIGLSLISSISYSDTLIHTCQLCEQIPIPRPICKAVSTLDTFCGAESWFHSGNQDCKQFMTRTVTCQNGSTQIYTYESWAGAGSNCNSQEIVGSHTCY